MDDELLGWLARLAAEDLHDTEPGSDDRLRRLLARPDDWLGLLHDAEAGQVLSNVARVYMPAALASGRDEQAAWLDRLHGFFAEALAVRCKDLLGHRSQGNNLSGACYMFFDHCDLRSLGQPELALSFFARLLALPSLACQESALHGLGHFHEDARDPRVVAVIDAAAIDERLAEYAGRARDGQVL